MARTKYIALRCTPYEHAALEALSECEDLSYSDLLRYLLRREVDFRGIQVVTEKADGDEEVAMAA